MRISAATAKPDDEHRLAISRVTAILQYYLGELYAANPPFTSAVTVSCLAPDLVQ